MAKTKISTSNFLFFPRSISFREISFREGDPSTHALQEGGIVSEETIRALESEGGHILPLPYSNEGGIINTPAFNWGEPMDEIEGIIPLPDDWDPPIWNDEDFPPPLTMPISIREDPKLTPRKCYDCKKEIGYGDFWIMNHKIMSNEILEKIWKSPYVELFCCTCFRKGVYLDKIIKKRERLLNKAYRINEKFGFLID